MHAEPAIAVIGGGGQYLDHNEAHRVLLGYELDELRSLGPAVIFGEENWDLVRAALIGTGRDSRDLTLSKRSGDKFDAQLTAFVLAEGVAVFLRDRTRDTLVAGVAHELNNPIAYVLSGLQYAARELAEPPSADVLEQVQQAIAEAESGVLRIRQVARALTGVAHAEDETIEQVDVRAVFDHALLVARSELQRRARIEREYHQVPLVRANSGRLGQVFLNLLVNAAQAIPEGAPETNIVRIVVRADDEASFVTLEVKDSGVGISPENLPRIFEPFFTTKREGTGLGLAICRDIVSRFGGTLAAESKPGRGAVFRIVFPAVRNTEPVRVLVIDDEPKIGEAFARMLELEHEVVACTGADEAFERLARGEKFAVIFCDVMMSDGGGRAFYERLAATMPELLRRLVMITGGAYTAEARTFLDSIPNRRLTKPIDPGVLVAMISEVCDL